MLSIQEWGRVQSERKAEACRLVSEFVELALSIVRIQMLEILDKCVGPRQSCCSDRLASQPYDRLGFGHCYGRGFARRLRTAGGANMMKV